LRRRLGRSQNRSGQVQKILPPPPISISFCILLYCVPKSSVLVSLFWLSCILSFVFTYSTQHKHQCHRWDSNQQPHQVTGRWP
jgi:hypothetical protein